jgi:Rab GDP dissociation inhibitor
VRALRPAALPPPPSPRCPLSPFSRTLLTTATLTRSQVLHIDRNGYYGGEAASLNLNQVCCCVSWRRGVGSFTFSPSTPPPPTNPLTHPSIHKKKKHAQQFFERFHPATPSPPPTLGPARDYNIDLVPKFIMGGGKLTQTLVRTGVTRYLEFKAVDGAFVLNRGRVERVPATDMEALRSPLMGLFEKRRARSFFIYVQDYRLDDPRTHAGRDLARMPMGALYAEFGLDPATVDFIGHGLALHTDDAYLNKPALETVTRIQLYNDSLHRFAGTRSPYIYPLYGLGELPQAFARLAAVHGGTYMLGQAGAEVVWEDGKAVGVTTENGTARAPLVVGDPSYFPGRTSLASRVVRAACILAHPIPGTADAASTQVILPQKQTGRRHDIYVFCCSAAHCVSPKGKWLAFVSTTVETDSPEAELAPGLALLGAIEEQAVWVTDVRVPDDDGKASRAFISRGYDATSHFESTIDDVLDLYTRITGKELDLEARPGGGEGGEEGGSAQA